MYPPAHPMVAGAAAAPSSAATQVAPTNQLATGGGEGGGGGYGGLAQIPPAAAAAAMAALGGVGGSASGGQRQRPHPGFGGARDSDAAAAAAVAVIGLSGGGAGVATAVVGGGMVHSVAGGGDGGRDERGVVVGGVAAAETSADGGAAQGHGHGGRPYGRSRGATFDGRDERHGGGDNASERGDAPGTGGGGQREGRSSFGPESMTAVGMPPPAPSRRGGSRDDFGMSVLAEVGAELSSLGGGGAGGAISGIFGAGGVLGVPGGRICVSGGVPSHHHPFSGKEPAAGVSGSTSTSFLDALSEEQRRVRTRHLPAVDGFRALGRSEVRRDMMAARAALKRKGSSGSLSSGRGGGPKRRGSGTLDSGNAVTAAEAANAEATDKVDEEPKSEDRMDVDEDEGIGISDYETTSDGSGGGGRAASSSKSGGKAEGGGSTTDLSGPEDAFVPPPEDFVTALTSGGTATFADGGGASAATTDQVPLSAPSLSSTLLPHQPRGPRYPNVIESITAFDPPRPPESIAPKKKHRLLRWERHPKDVEVDLASYRKTVSRTREELHNAERERERIEATGMHLRMHFLHQLQIMGEESALLDDELGVLRGRCLEASELLTSKTRSRGTGRGGDGLMRDVLAALKARGSSAARPSSNGDISMPDVRDVGDSVWCLPGIGGISGDGDIGDIGIDGEAEDGAPSIARGWLLPGDRVDTPYGQGTVLHVFGPSVLDVRADVPEGATVKRRDRPRAVPPKRHGFGGVAAGTAATAASPAKLPHPRSVQSGASPAAAGGGGKPPSVPPPKSTPKARAARGGREHRPRGGPSDVLAARVCVRLCFGVAYFSSFDGLRCTESAAAYNDEQLLGRWRKILDSAGMVGSCADVVGIDGATAITGARSRHTAGTGGQGEAAAVLKDEGSASGHSVLLKEGTDREGVVEGADSTSGEKEDERMGLDRVSEEASSPRRSKKNRLLPVGANMLRSPGLSGFLLSEVPLDVLERNLDSVLFGGHGDLAREGNPGVPADFKAWENQRYEVSGLRGRVLQLRNQLYRQRRIRILNERSRISGQERAERVESLLLEMKSDLISLKERLQDELIELGIDQEKAEELLGVYMKAHEMDEIGHRRHRMSSSEDHYDNEIMQSNDNSISADQPINLDESAMRRVNKRGRSEVDSSSGAEGNKAKRTGFRRQ